MNPVESVKFIDFSAEDENLLLKIEDAVKDVVRSGTHILGEHVKSFEGNWAKYVGVVGAVGVGNGLDALEICLRNANVGPGDEVITTPLTAFATTLAILRVGATPVYADIDPDTGIMCLVSARRCISNRARAILLVHLYGFIDIMEDWQALCAEYNLALIEDCAQAHGAKYRDKMAGSFGASAAFSFYPTKNLGAIGDGGCLVSNDLDIIQNAMTLRNYGQKKTYEVDQYGMNSRLDELQAAILNVKLPFLDENINRRRKNAQNYFSEIKNRHVSLLRQADNADQHAYHLFVVKVQDRKGFSEYLKKNGIDSLIHYPVINSKQKLNYQKKLDPYGLDHAEDFSNKCLSIPISHLMTEDQQQYVIQVINRYERI